MNVLLYNINSETIKKPEQPSESTSEIESNETDDMLLSDDILKSHALDLDSLRKMLVKNKHGKDTLFSDMG